MAWKHIHIPIHSIWSLLINFYMLWVEVGTIPCGLRASTTVHGCIFWSPAPTKDSSWPPWSWPTSVVVPAWRRIHIPIKSIQRLSITFYMSGVPVHIIPCEFRASTISWQYHLVFSRYLWFQFSGPPTSGLIRAEVMAWRAEVMAWRRIHIYRQHIKFITHLFYSEWMCGNHSMWV